MHEPETRPAEASASPGTPLPLSLRVNFSWTFLGNVFEAGAAAGMLVILAKLQPPDVVGLWILGQAVVSPILLFSMLNLRAIQATDARRNYSFGDYLGLRLLTTALAILAIAAVACLEYGPPATAIVIATAVSSGVVAIADVVFGHLQNRERMDRVGVSRMLKAGISLLAMTAALLAANSLVVAILATAAARAAILVVYDLPNALWVLGRRGRIPSLKAMRKAGLLPRFEPKALVGLSRLALPLGVTMLLVSLNPNIPRYLVEKELGVTELGIFGAIAYFMVAGTAIINSLGQAAAPRLAGYYAERQFHAFRRLVFRLMLTGIGIGLAATCVSLLVGRYALTILFAPEYAEHAPTLVLVAAASGFTLVASVAGYAITAAHYFRSQIPIQAAGALASAVAGVMFIPAFGILGAGFSLLLASIVLCGANLFALVHALSRLRKACAHAQAA